MSTLTISKKSVAFSALIAISLALTACGDSYVIDPLGASSQAKNINAEIAQVAISAEPAGANCVAGGAKISAGFDTDKNGTLDASEATTTQYACNGIAGVSGTSGASGKTSLTSLVKVLAESAGANCVTAGSKITSGLDTNGNGVLDNAEVTATSYVCNGNNGNNGTNGNNGANGLSTLVKMAAEISGANCAYGGNKVTSGIDANGDGFLANSEVSFTSYTCNGAPGPGITWIEVTDRAIDAQANKGYIANSLSQVVITLPTSAAIGDIIQISGAGAGGWKIAQNAEQVIAVRGTPNDSLPGALWNAQGRSTGYSLASSSDGTKLVASGTDGVITSNDSGASWVPNPSAPLARLAIANSVASSADGSKLFAIENIDGNPNQSGSIYASTDAGITWNRIADARHWTSIASSADGTKLVATDHINRNSGSGYIYTSSDSGATWTQSGDNVGWQSIAMSSDGSKLIAASYKGKLYSSSDFGVTWIARDTDRFWSLVGSSADGTKLFAAESAGNIYTSVDSGQNWISRAPTADWFALASSTDGTKLVATANGKQIFTSSDSGVTWVLRDASHYWFGVASSADGRKLFSTDREVAYLSIADITTSGIDGSLSGSQYDSVTLQCLGKNLFSVISYVSASGQFKVK
jgi:hypothetical protein